MVFDKNTIRSYSIQEADICQLFSFDQINKKELVNAEWTSYFENK